MRFEKKEEELIAQSTVPCYNRRANAKLQIQNQW
jgi:hypothetical protein